MPGIAPILSYPLPDPVDLPKNAASWIPEPKRSVLLIHDMQRYFVAPFESKFRDQLISNCRRLIDRCIASEVPLVFSAQPGDMTERQRGLLKDIWGSGMRSDPSDRQIVDELRPRPIDKILTKWRYSAFYRSDLLDTIRDQDRDQLIICGVYAHVGILSTALEAFSHNIQPFMVADALGDFSEKYHQMALSYAAERCAVVTVADRVFR